MHGIKSNHPYFLILWMVKDMKYGIVKAVDTLGINMNSIKIYLVSKIILLEESLKLLIALFFPQILESY